MLMTGKHFVFRLRPNGNTQRVVDTKVSNYKYSGSNQVSEVVGMLGIPLADNMEKLELPVR